MVLLCVKLIFLVCIWVENLLWSAIYIYHYVCLSKKKYYNKNDLLPHTPLVMVKILLVKVMGDKYKRYIDN